MEIYMISGHYVTYLNDSIEDSWVMCNDSRVKKVDLSKALCDSVATCYLLVYEAVEKSLESTIVNDISSHSEAISEEDAAADEEPDSQSLSYNSENEGFDNLLFIYRLIFLTFTFNQEIDKYFFLTGTCNHN